MENRKKVMILSPMGRMIEYEGAISIMSLCTYLMQNGYGIDINTVSGLPHAIARNKLFNDSIKLLLNDKDFKYVLWLDSDHNFLPKDFMRLLKRFDDEKLDILSAGYFTKTLPPALCALRIHDRLADGSPNKYTMLNEFTTGELYEVDAVGFGMLLMKPEVMIRLREEHGVCPFSFTVRNGPQGDHLIGEDVAFCEKAKALGYKIYVDAGTIIGHMGTMNVDIDGAQYLLARGEKYIKQQKALGKLPIAGESQEK